MSTQPAESSDMVPLVIAAQRGDRAAFAQLHGRCRGLVHGVLLAVMRTSDIDDAVQEVFLTAWSHLKELRDPSSMPAWLATIARRQATRRLRKRRPGASPLTLHLDVPAPTSENDPKARADAVFRAILALPEPYHEPLILRLVEGLSGPQIAAALGTTHGSVRVNLCRGFSLLRASLEKEESA